MSTIEKIENQEKIIKKIESPSFAKVFKEIFTPTNMAKTLLFAGSLYIVFGTGCVVKAEDLLKAGKAANKGVDAAKEAFLRKESYSRMLRGAAHKTASGKLELFITPDKISKHVNYLHPLSPISMASSSNEALFILGASLFSGVLSWGLAYTWDYFTNKE